MKALEILLTLCCIGANIHYILAGDLVSFPFILMAVGLYLAATAIHMIFHELGHLAGGLASSYGLVFLSFGPVYFCRSPQGKLSIRFFSHRGGQCVMVPGKAVPCPYLSYNLGGIWGNCLVCLMACLLLLGNSWGCFLLFLDLMLVGTQKLLLNCIPSKSMGFPSDMFVIRLLGREPDTRYDYAMYLKLYAALTWSQEIHPEEYRYHRPVGTSPDALMYYNEIQTILAELEK